VNLDENPTFIPVVFVSTVVYIKSEIKRELIIFITTLKIRAYQSLLVKAAIGPGVFRLALAYRVPTIIKRNILISAVS